MFEDIAFGSCGFITARFIDPLSRCIDTFMSRHLQHNAVGCYYSNLLTHKNPNVVFYRWYDNRCIPWYKHGTTMCELLDDPFIAEVTFYPYVPAVSGSFVQDMEEKFRKAAVSAITTNSHTFPEAYKSYEHLLLQRTHCLDSNDKFRTGYTVINEILLLLMDAKRDIRVTLVDPARQFHSSSGIQDRNFIYLPDNQQSITYKAISVPPTELETLECLKYVREDFLILFSVFLDLLHTHSAFREQAFEINTGIFIPNIAEFISLGKLLNTQELNSELWAKIIHVYNSLATQHGVPLVPLSESSTVFNGEKQLKINTKHGVIILSVEGGDMQGLTDEQCRDILLYIDSSRGNNDHDRRYARLQNSLVQELARRRELDKSN